MPADAPKRPPRACAVCGFQMWRFQTGNEIACTDCDGRLCEQCCERKEKVPHAR